jgi:hypothetical protein
VQAEACGRTDPIAIILLTGGQQNGMKRAQPPAAISAVCDPHGVLFKALESKGKISFFPVSKRAAAIRKEGNRRRSGIRV